MERYMNVAVIGAGAVGGFLAARMSRVGIDVSIIDLDEHLDAIRSRGIEIIEPDGDRWSAKVGRCAESCEELGPHDLVILGTKSFQLQAAVREIRSLFHEKTVAITVQNGLPWWFFEGWGGPAAGHRFRSLDPEGILGAAVEPERILGCVAYMAAGIESPGVIRHVEGERFPMGWLDGSDRSPLPEVAELFASAGLKARVLPDIRSEVWLKLAGSAAFNPISALTGATMAEICRHPEGRQLAWDVMVEVEQIGKALGISLRVPLERRMAGAEAVGQHKTSMLQDVEHRRKTESDAIMGAPLETAALMQVETPGLRALHGALELLTAPFTTPEA
jgi:2-dehydropantoate 2-reductase